jgi:hypothetical protein
MSLAAVVATLMLALLMGFVALVIYATMHQLRDEASRAANERRRFGDR